MVASKPAKVAQQPAAAAELPEDTTEQQQPQPEKKKRAGAKATVEEEWAQATAQRAASTEMWVTDAIRALMKRKRVGAHVSAAGGPHCALRNAQTLGANAAALFLKSQRKWENPPLSPENVSLFTQFAAPPDNAVELDAILPHGSYLINLASPVADAWEKSYVAFVDDLRRCEALGIRRYNFQ
jgi:AP endonuclease-1